MRGLPPELVLPLDRALPAPLAVQLADGLRDAADAAGIPLTINRVGSMLGVWFVASAGQAVENYRDATASDVARYGRFFHAMLERGVYLPPSQYEAWFIGLAHDDDAIKQTLRAARDSFALLSA